MGYLLALDQGTTSSRALVFDTDGRLITVAQREFTQHYPQPGWVEHDPEEIWQTQIATARAALAQAGIHADAVLALGITNQRETTLLWERASGRPVANAIVWQDRRTAAACAALKARGLESLFRERTGLMLDPYFSGTKLAWLLDHVPGVRARAERGELAFGTVDSYLIWRLTGGRAHVTDVTNAARTLLFDIHRRSWDEELLGHLGVPRALLPEVRASAGDFGTTQADLLGAPVRIGGVAGDQQAALFGQACTAPGMVKNTYGTGCFMLLHTGSTPVASRHGLLTTPVAQAGPEPGYALEGSIFVAGAVVQWLRDELGLIRSANEVEALAASVPDTAGVYLVPAFAGLGSPYWDADARGALFGLTRGANRAHIARAALEAIAFQSAEMLQAMQADAAQPIEMLRVDGGATANALLMQIQADLIGIPVVVAAVQETTALGAAYLAGIQAGVWRSAADVGAYWQSARTFEPVISRDEAAVRLARWREAVSRTRGWVSAMAPDS
ncbi:glycerol kinase GlpK [Candidatus Macondimonas diazotrophica]|jgi:glycerol kinase|uniref:Glycerol kinase n=1 Tax=Candidatus Macondimonas diazotrophica TaxID=2305248 RepID=A0A4Z0F9U5_9GAMM|nr:glycerol kinase GlpK [Candidatus Macondimonas diazotrophica]TFZ82398.1 glycerol kinase GlpK [Candidatus Macondimonas diazotrophica]